VDAIHPVVDPVLQGFSLQQKIYFPLDSEESFTIMAMQNRPHLALSQGNAYSYIERK